MNFEIDKSIEMLSRTPVVVETMLSGLSNEWIYSNEGGETWSPFDILGHFIEGEKTDWIPRMKIILGDGDKKFKPFDRFAQLKTNEGKTINELLNEFKNLRAKNISVLKEADINDAK